MGEVVVVGGGGGGGGEKMRKSSTGHGAVGKDARTPLTGLMVRVLVPPFFVSISSISSPLMVRNSSLVPLVADAT